MECSICLDVINGPNNVVVTNCGHTFHCLCLMSNIAHMNHNRLNCPNCRQSLSYNNNNEVTLTENEDDDVTLTDNNEAQPNIQFALGPIEPISVPVVVHEVVGTEYFMDQHYRLYNMNTRNFVGYANLWEETIEYDVGLFGGVQTLEHYIVVENFGDDDDLSFGDDEESIIDIFEDMNHTEFYELYINESNIIEANEAPEAICG
jgi:hypothetical protein